MPQSNLPIVAFVGLPNVGKSSLFNRLLGRKKALVQDRPGVTRDRQWGDLLWDSVSMTLLDTGGLDLHKKNRLQAKISQQSQEASTQADLVCLVVDGRAGVDAIDQALLSFARKMGKPVFLVVSKIDSSREEILVSDFYSLGFEHVFHVSAETGHGVGSFLDALSRFFKEKGYGPNLKEEEEKENDDDDEKEEEKGDEKTHVAIVGRPNVGKSTLTNRLLGEERVIADEMPGTTTDSVDVLLDFEGKKMVLIDTAGIRKRGPTKEFLEKVSVLKSLKTLDRADVCLLLLDGTIGVTEQDAHVAGEAFGRMKPMVILVNKWDEASKTKDRESIKNDIQRKMAFVSHCPVLFISAQTGKNCDKIFPTVLRLNAQSGLRVGTGALNKAFEKIMGGHPLPVYRGKNIKIYYITQISVHPPTFVIFANEPKHIHFSYQRYIINRLSEIFGFGEVPLRVLYRKKRH